MKHYKSLFNDLHNIDKPIIKTNKRVEYYNIACGFDIETSSVEIGDEKAAFMYIWMIGIGHGNEVYYGRTWEELQELMQFLELELNLSDKKRLVVYVHNLAYEFQFMRKYFSWDDEGIFAIDERKPIKALTTGGIEFRDSYILSGFSLANTAKNLTKYKVKKMVGDLDYSLTRTYLTPLTTAELGYCENDIIVVTAYIQEQIEQYLDVTKIPLTNTGRVRNYVRDACYYTSKNHRKSSKSKYLKYRQVMDDLTLDRDTYRMLKKSFMGGFTHANANHVDKVLYDVSSVDFTSSYPSVMISEQFPMSRFRDVKIESLKQLEEYCAQFAMVFEIKFTNLQPIFQHEQYISRDKCSILENPVVSNGRIVSAEVAAMTITEIDLDIIKRCYSWDSVAIGQAKLAHKNYLPKAIIEAILKLYQDKTVLKDVEGSEVEYLLSKGMLNSVYGMCVTDIVKDKTVYHETWEKDLVDVDSEIEDYNKSKKRFLYYAWGIWVTAYARRNLWSGIIACGEDYIYSDTDSLKMFNYESHLDYINFFNDMIVKKMCDMCDYYKIDKELLSPKTKEGKIKTMGVWDYEGLYSHFKTLGAKRYMLCDNGKLKLTVAGLSKQNGINYMKEHCNNNIMEVFNMFKDGMYIPADKTGKMTHTYIDEKLSFMIEDYQGVKAEIHTESGVHLESCDYTLTMGVDYKSFLKQLSKGYIYKGVKHI